MPHAPPGRPPNVTPHPAARAARAARRWAARLAAGAAGLALVGVGLVYGLSERRMRARFAVPDHPLAVPADGAAVGRGRRLAARDGCRDCHGPGFAGRVVIDEPAIIRLVAPDLTAGGRGAALSNADWERAVRHGVRRDGRPIIFMPAHEFRGLADDELAAVVAYARSLPGATGAADARTRRALPATRVGPVGRALFLAGQVPLVPAELIDHGRAHPASVPAAPTAAYGAYLAAGCTGCHGATYAGGPIPGAPPSFLPAANITPDSAAGIGRWTEADFVHALRDGRRPNGTLVRPPMPLAATRAMTDVELAALWAYLRTLPARPTGAD